MGGAPSGSSTTTTNPPKYVTPVATDYLKQAQSIFSPNAANPYPEQQVAPFSQMQQQGFNAIQGMGDQSALINQAQGNLSNTMGQNAIDNPLLGQYAQSAMDQLNRNYTQTVMPGITSSALQSGTFGGSGQQEAMSNAQQNYGSAASNLLAGIYEPAWNQQAGFQQNAAQLSPYLAQAGYMPAQEMLQAGGAQQQQQQNILNTLYQNLFQKANFPTQQMNNLGQAIGLSMGSGGITSVKMT